MLVAASALAAIPDLDSLHWKNRVLLLFSPEAGSRELAEQQVKLDAEAAGLHERDMKVFEIVGGQAGAAGLRSRFGVKPDRFTVVLIGKDGGSKLKKSGVVDVASLFSKVDSMPMRRSEMRNASGSDKSPGNDKQ